MKHIREVKIGVTGHRFLSDIPSLVRGINLGLLLVEQCFEGCRLTILSALAEGADRLVVKCAMKMPSARLVVALPSEQDTYLQDFTDETSKKEFSDWVDRASGLVQLPEESTRQQGYQAVGRYIAQNCDVLFALWDGLSSQGLGGTGEVVLLARLLGKPVVIVRCGNRKPGTNSPTTLYEEQGAITTERLTRNEIVVDALESTDS